MAVRLICNSRRIIAFPCNLRVVAQSVRNFSSSDRRRPQDVSSSEISEDILTDGNDVTIWPDPHLGVLGPRDNRMPLPGNVGVGSQISKEKELELPRSKVATDVLTSVLPHERHITILSQSINAEQIEDDYNSLDVMAASADVLECIAHDCPRLVRRDFADLFPGTDVNNGPFTVITLSQKTKNDMIGWSSDMELEREELMLYFVVAAENICSQLKAAGYWADFIDPSSGHPYLGPFTHSTMFETDERYRHLGFTIEDLGCCKVINHKAWGTHAYVGCLFTSAPANSAIIHKVLERHAQGEPNV